MSQHCPHHPDAPAQDYTPQIGRDTGVKFITCSQFLGQGALGANKNGYCSWREKAETPQSPQEARPASGSSPEPSGAHLRLLVASAALQAAAYGSLGSEGPDGVLARAVVYAQWLKRVVLGDVPAPVPKPVPVVVPPPPPDEELPF